MDSKFRPAGQHRARDGTAGQALAVGCGQQVIFREGREVREDSNPNYEPIFSQKEKAKPRV
jgi:hypothetical protein